MKIFLDTAPVEAANFASPWRSAQAGGLARPYVSWDRGTKRHAPVQVRPYLSRFNASLASADNRRGRKRVCHAHVHHHWPPREVQEEVPALGVALGVWREPCRTGGAAGVGGGSSIGACSRIGRRE